MNLFSFYFYRLIGKLTVFLQLQEFILCNMTVDCSTSSMWCSPHNSSLKWETPSPRCVNLNIDGTPIVTGFTITHSPLTLANFSSINIVYIFRCSSLPRNSVYVRRVDPSDLVFILSSHRHSYISLLFRSRFVVL